jgi:RNA polymerase sigma factor (sigma-70 family)
VSAAAPTDDGLWRQLAPQTLARLLRRVGAHQFDVCEDAVQDALLEAHRQWPQHPPDDPQAWLLAAARRRYVDRVRAERRRRGREERVALLEAPLAREASEHDDALLVLQMCCHPALSRSAQVALTLRAVAGLTTEQIANAYHVPTATIAQRITRAKRRIDELGGTFPAPADGDDRLAPVLDVLYVMLTEAHHTATGAPPSDADLAAEAIHLARLLRAAAPQSTEAGGLLALMLLTEARHPARVGPQQQLIPLDEQDRSRWDQEQVREGLALLDAITPNALPGPYLLQACIAGVHARAASTETTDWEEIDVLYALLERATGGRNPTVSLNRIVAQAMPHGEERALAALDELASRHPELPRLESVRAHLLERAGRRADAAEAYRRAIASTVNVAEQRHLRGRLRRLT